MRVVNRLAVAAVVLAGLLAGSARAQVMEQVPADAMVVVKLSNPQATSAKISAFAKQVGMEMEPFGDPLSFALEQIGIKEGIRKDGQAAIVVFAPKGEAGEPPVMGLVPVTDYQAFLGNFKDPQKEGDVTVVSPEGIPTQLYIAKWGDFAAVSASKALLAKKPGGLKLAEQSAKLLNNDKIDLSVYANAAPIRDMALPELKQQREQMVKQAVATYLENDGMEKYAPVIRTLVEQGLDLLQNTLQDAEAGVFAISMTDEGWNTTMLAEFAPSSKTGSMIKQIQNTDASLLRGLPQADYVVYGGMSQKSDVFSKFLSDVLAPVKAQLKQVGGEDAQAFVTAIDAYTDYMKATTGGSFGAVLDPQAQQGMLKGTFVMEGDANAMMNAQEQMRKLGPVLGGIMPGPKQAMQYTENAKTVEGVKLDKTTVEVKYDAGDPAQAMMKQITEFLYGKQGPVVYVGVVNPNRLVQILGGEEEFLQKAVAAAKAGEDPLAQANAVKAVNAQLPQKRFAVGYVAVDKIITFALSMENQAMGGGMQLQLPPNLPPVAFSMSSEGAALRADTHVPRQLVQALISAFNKLQADMENRGGAGRPGDL